MLLFSKPLACPSATQDAPASQTITNQQELSKASQIQSTKPPDSVRHLNFSSLRTKLIAYQYLTVLILEGKDECREQEFKKLLRNFYFYKFNETSAK